MKFGAFLDGVATTAAGRDAEINTLRCFGSRIWLLVVSGIALGGLTASSVRAVTDAMLMKPDAADWPSFAAPLDGHGYSPTNQINRQNVNQLQLVWSWALQSVLMIVRR